MNTDHAAQSRHNGRAYDLIHSQTPTYVDWEITTTFYAALHLIDKRLKDLGKTVINHRQRLDAVKRHLPEMYDLYGELYTMSVAVRYSGIDAVNADIVQDARRTYEKLENELQSRSAD